MHLNIRELHVNIGMGVTGSPHREEVETLRKRAGDFLALAREALGMGSIDVSCFLSEQAAQLHVKSVLLEEVGDYPRTHSIRNLLAEVSRSFGEEEIGAFLHRNRVRLIALEDAYIIARYTPARYTREDAEDLLSIAEETIEVTSREGKR